MTCARPRRILPAMDFASRLQRQPIPDDPDAGAEAARAFADLGPELVGLLAGVAGCSPYLRALMTREADWLRDSVVRAPEDVLNGLVAAPRTAAGLAELPAELRRIKRRVALWVALADCGGVWPLETVTGALTRFADRAVDLTLRALIDDALARGRLPGAPDGGAEAAGMVVLAMGKMGAEELNYSSDIDLICLFDDSRHEAADLAAVRAEFIRITRRLCAILSEPTADGYVFRTDLRLRPDPAVTPVCLSIAAAEGYYESLGRTWERAAFIKARPCAGDLAAGHRFLAALRPFVWRRHLDFAAIQDAHDMRLRIRTHKGLGGPLVLEGHDVKLGRGGIREIEFFTQTRQLIAGGRDPDLRPRGTVAALRALCAKGWIPRDASDALSDAYRAHRLVEHRLQMIQDAQTHSLPGQAEGFRRLAHFLGRDDVAAWRGELSARFAGVEALTGDFFAPRGGADPADARGPDTPSAALPEPALSEAAEAIIAGWPSYPALRSQRAVEIFSRLRPGLLRRLGRAADPDRALRQFDAFLGGLPAGVQLFALFEANPTLVDLIVDIAATAPGLAQYLGRNAGVLDAVIGGDFFAPWPGEAALSRELAAILARAADYEAQLDAARRWHKEWHFRIGVHLLRGLADAFEAGAQYADLAGAVLSALWPICGAEFARKHGLPPGRGAAVLGMGSLGAGRLHSGSDLDLIVVYDEAGTETSEGPRPLPARSYYARLTQAFVTALSAPMAEGRLYQVDMRLRPSGRQGPVATAMAAFRSYQREEAWTWEHLALTRARPVAGSDAIGAEIETFRRALLTEKARGETVLADVAAMRARLRAARPGAGAWEVRDGPGRLMDVELLAQTAALCAASPARGPRAQLAAAGAAGWPGPDVIEAASDAYRLCWRIRCVSKLLADRAVAPDALGAGAAAVLLHECDAPDLESLERRLDRVTDRAARLIDGALGGQEGTATAAGGAVAGKDIAGGDG